MTPLISIVLTGRNDGYGGDFIARFFRTLRFNHRQLTDRGIAHEIVFVEWAPPRKAPRLFDLVFDAIPDLDRNVCAWYVVDARYQDVLTLNPRLAYLEFIAKNVGIRRACGRFVLTTNCDVCLGRQVLETISKGDLNPETVYRAPRYDVKMGVDQSSLDWAMLEDPRNLDDAPKRLKPPFMGGGTGDFILVEANTLRSLGGFNEVYRVARLGVDHNFLVKALSSGLTIEDIGGPVYHVNHAGSYRTTKGAYKGREHEAHWGNKRWHSRGVIYVNPPTWGLAQAPAHQESERCWHLDFSWNAVPPLVDLRRIVLPVARRGGPAPGRYVARS